MARGIVTPCAEAGVATLHAFADAEQRVRHLASAVLGHLRDALRERGDAVLAVSGGRSPAPLFEALSGLPLDWSRVTVTLVDERLVPATHADSNEALVRGHLLRGAAAQATFIGLVGAQRGDTRRWLREANATPRRADVVVLGMGQDGHVASLFSDAAGQDAGVDRALDPHGAEHYVAMRPMRAAHARIGLSLAALLQAPHLLLHIEGAPKLRCFERALAAALAARAARHADPPPADAGPAIERLLRHHRGGIEVWWGP